jgi:AraC-like DNA-binding protein
VADHVELTRDGATGVETIRAHFEGHAYDPHWHESYLVGVTEQGLQRFHCRKTRHHSTPGKIILLEPGELHDGDAPSSEGFTYRMLYLPPDWLAERLASLFENAPDRFLPSFESTLAEDPLAANAIWRAFETWHHGEPRIVRDVAFDGALTSLTRHLRWRRHESAALPDARLTLLACDYLHAHFCEDVGLDTLAQLTGMDRFRLTRAFKSSFGIPPHAYLIQLRLIHARALLASGVSPANTATEVGFADQSHLGRWFRRAYRLTPAHYRRAAQTF